MDPHNARRPPQLPGSHYAPAAPFITARNRANDTITTDRIVDANKSSQWRVVDFSERHAEELHAIAQERRQRKQQAANYDRRIQEEDASFSRGPTSSHSFAAARPIPRLGDPQPPATPKAPNMSGNAASSSLWMKMADAARGDPNDPGFWVAKERVTSQHSRRVPITSDFERRGKEHGEVVSEETVQKNVAALKRYLGAVEGNPRHPPPSTSAASVLDAAGPRTTFVAPSLPSSPLRDGVGFSSMAPPPSLLSNAPLAQQIPMFLANLTLKRALASPQHVAVANTTVADAPPPPPLHRIHYPFTEIDKLMKERDFGVDDVLSRLGFTHDVQQRIDRLLRSNQYLMQCCPDGRVVTRYVTLEAISVNALVSSRKLTNQQLSVMNDGDADGGDDYALRMFLGVYGSRDTRMAPVLGRLALDQMVDVTLGCAFLSNSALAHLRNASDGELSATMRLEPKDETLMSAGVAKFVQQHRPKAPKLVTPPAQQAQFRQAMGDFSTALEATYPVLVGPPTGYERRALLPSRQCFSVWFLSDDGGCATVVHFVTENADLTAEWLAVLRALLLLNDAKRVLGALGVSPPEPAVIVPSGASVNASKEPSIPKTLEDRRWHCVCKVDEAQRLAKHGEVAPTSAPGVVQASSRGKGLFSGASFKGLADQHRQLGRPPPLPTDVI
jgi:hypothetical protein